MIKSFFGIKRSPFEKGNITLTSQQKTIYDIVKIHSRQGGLCIIAGDPGTGKTEILNAIQKLRQDKSIEVPSISRTMHSYQNIIRILLEAFKLEGRHSAKDCEADILAEAFKLNSQGKTLITIIDDAHLLKSDVLRKLRLLFDEFPINHNLVLIGQTELLQRIALSSNADIKSRITYSVKVNKLNPQQIEETILAELDKCGLAHSVFDESAIELIIRNTEGLLRQCKNLVLGSLVQATAEGKRNINTDIVNSVLIQPHWRSYDELLKL
jgi:MSHA biogenesis protein MshM